MPETLGFNPENEKSWRKANHVDTSEGLVSALGDKEYDDQEMKDFAAKWSEARASEHGPEVKEVVEKLQAIKYATKKDVSSYREKLKEVIEAVSDPKILVDVLKYSNKASKDIEDIKFLVHSSWDSSEGDDGPNSLPDSLSAVRFFQGGLTTDKEIAIRDALKEAGGAVDDYIIKAFGSGEIGMGSSAGFAGDTGIFGAIYDKQFLRQVVVEEILAPDVNKNGYSTLRANGNMPLALAATRLGELGGLSKEDWHLIGNEMASERNMDSAVMKITIEHITDKTYLRNLLDKFATKGKVKEDWSTSYVRPFESNPCLIIKKLDDKDRVEVINGNYGENTKLFSLSLVKSVRGVTDETLIEILGSPHNMQATVHEVDDGGTEIDGYRDFDFGQQALKVSVITKGLLDTKLAVLEELSWRAQDEAVQKAAQERLNQIDS